MVLLWSVAALFPAIGSELGTRVLDAATAEQYLRPVRPEPYPAGRTQAQWEAFLDGLFRQWGSRWYNPGAAASEGLKALPYR